MINIPYRHIDQLIPMSYDESIKPKVYNVSCLKIEIQTMIAV